MRACTRAPSRCTANTTALYLVRNFISPRCSCRRADRLSPQPPGSNAAPASSRRRACPPGPRSTARGPGSYAETRRNRRCPRESTSSSQSAPSEGSATVTDASAAPPAAESATVASDRSDASRAPSTARAAPGHAAAHVDGLTALRNRNVAASLDGHQKQTRQLPQAGFVRGFLDELRPALDAHRDEELLARLVAVRADDLQVPVRLADRLERRRRGFRVGIARVTRRRV